MEHQRDLSGLGIKLPRYKVALVRMHLWQILGGIDVRDEQILGQADQGRCDFATKTDDGAPGRR